MNKRCRIALSYPLARADQAVQSIYRQCLYVENRPLSTIVTLNK